VITVSLDHVTDPQGSLDQGNSQKDARCDRDKAHRKLPAADFSELIEKLFGRMAATWVGKVGAHGVSFFWRESAKHSFSISLRHFPHSLGFLLDGRVYRQRV
jgi:hypothetical protein